MFVSFGGQKRGEEKEVDFRRAGFWVLPRVCCFHRGPFHFWKGCLGEVDLGHPHLWCWRRARRGRESERAEFHFGHLHSGKPTSRDEPNGGFPRLMHLKLPPYPRLFVCPMHSSESRAHEPDVQRPDCSQLQRIPESQRQPRLPPYALWRTSMTRCP